ncbi:hypothetical protein PsorP6_015474 [Peronosclerospora sorghi]|uniref:Uncharacterized protein n=1 Tax=Peronosclerospora sorghi TaxID=230839 RepID=A0ACC0WNT5_9STRA|nr:hypothetical protein PsorP6_015474 [Peronosclerospora sorghi]
MVTLYVKTTAGKKFPVDVALKSTVLQCKESLVASTEVPTSLQRIIHKGNVLKVTRRSKVIEFRQNIPFTLSKNQHTCYQLLLLLLLLVHQHHQLQLHSVWPRQRLLLLRTAGSGTMFGDLMGAGGSAMNMQQMQQQMQQQMMNNSEMVRQMMDWPMYWPIMQSTPRCGTLKVTRKDSTRCDACTMMFRNPLWKLLQVEHLLLEGQHLRYQELLVAPI